jgi:hypothetical protein
MASQPETTAVRARTASWRRLDAVLLLSALVGCGDSVALEVARAVDRTVPGPQKPSSPEIGRDGWSATASWEFETTMDWLRYQGWVEERLPGFDRRPSGHSGVVIFVRTLEGDVQTIRLQVIRVGSPTRIRATFTAEAW